jgi:dienelactone hydrolase
MPVARLLTTLLLLSSSGTSVLGAGKAEPRRQAAAITVQCSPVEGLLNDVVAIRISGLAPGSQVTVLADTVLAGTWRARATFVVDRTGTINLDRQAPIEGTYQGVDTMGLFTSGEPVNDPATQNAPPPDIREQISTTFRVEREGVVIATASCQRQVMPPAVRSRDIRDDGLVGEFFEPTGTGPHPALLVLGGSEGGIDRYSAAGLAARGYAALALAYFRMPSLPAELVNIPLEYPLKAVAWLRNQPSVDANRVGVYGGSRGAELALVVASRSRDIRAVAVFAPSSVTWAGVGPQNAGRPSWTWAGRGLPMVPVPFTLDSFRAGGTANEAAIPVEESLAAMFLVSGGEDRVWPIKVAPLMGEMIVARLKAHQYRFPVEHWSYPAAGHSIRMFYIPGPMLSGGGGTPKANAAAMADLTPRLFGFLKRYLAGN